MSETTQINIQARLDDNVTRPLQRINRNLRRLGSSASSIRDVTRQFESLSQSMENMSQSMSTFNLAGDLERYNRQLRRSIALQRQMNRVSNSSTNIQSQLQPQQPQQLQPQNIPSSENFRGFSTLVGAEVLGEMISSLTMNFLSSAFSFSRSLIEKPLNYLINSFGERISDQMSDIQGAGGMMSIAKKSGLEFADTYEEAMELQKRLNNEMATLAAALPGETNQYVQNMKLVTDSTMGLFKTKDMAQRSIKVAQEFNKEVNNEQEAFVEMTKQLAKLSTLGAIGQDSGIPLPVIIEKILSQEKVNIESLANTYAALENNPLLVGALKDFQKDMNKAAAKTPERMKSIIDALTQAFPPEVIAAMENSVDGMYQAMRSAIFDPDTGIFGLGRAFEIDFSGVKNMIGEETKKTMSFFEFFADIFMNFGIIVGPILSFLPQLFEPFETIINPLKEFYVNMQNTGSNFRGALEFLKDVSDSTKFVRASIYALGKLAKAWGADLEMSEESFKALVEVGSVSELFRFVIGKLFDSDGLQNLGNSIGQAIGGFFSLIGKFFGETGELVNNSGLIKGFVEGFRKSGGITGLRKIFSVLGATITKLLVTGIKEIIKSIPGIIKDIFKDDPLFGTGLLLSGFAALLPAISSFATIVASLVAAFGLVPVAIGAIAVGLGLLIFFFRDDIASFIRDVGLGLNQTLKDITGRGFKQLGPDLMLGLKYTWEQFSGGVKSFLDNLFIGISLAKASVENGYSKFIGKLSSFIIGIMDSFFQIKLRVSDTINSILRSLTEIRNSILESIPGLNFQGEEFKEITVFQDVEAYKQQLEAEKQKNLENFRASVSQLPQLGSEVSSILSSEVNKLKEHLTIKTVNQEQNVNVEQGLNPLNSLFTSIQSSVTKQQTNLSQNTNQTMMGMDNMSNQVSMKITETSNNWNNSMGIINQSTAQMTSSTQIATSSMSLFFDSLPAQFANLQNKITTAVNNVSIAPVSVSVPTTTANFKGSMNPSKFMPLMEAYNHEKKNSPPGSYPVMANSSEIIIPTANEGYNLGSLQRQESSSISNNSNYTINLNMPEGNYNNPKEIAMKAIYEIEKALKKKMENSIV